MLAPVLTLVIPWNAPILYSNSADFVNLKLTFH